MRLVFLLPLAGLSLAACDGSGTSISINANSEDGNAVVSTDANGQMAIRAPGFEGAIKLPKIDIDAEDFDINGVYLYPGSKITNLNVEAQEQAGTQDKGEVQVTFTSPASPAAVQTWFRDRMTAKGFKVEADGTGLKGTTDEGDPFTLALAPDGDGKARGQLRLGN